MDKYILWWADDLSHDWQIDTPQPFIDIWRSKLQSKTLNNESIKKYTFFVYFFLQYCVFFFATLCIFFLQKTGNDYSNKIEKYYIYNLKNKKERTVSIYNDFQKIEISNYITEYDNLGRVIKEVEIIEEVPVTKNKVIATLEY